MTLPNRSIRIDPAHVGMLNAMLDLLRKGRADDVAAALSTLQADPGRRPVGPFRSAAAALDFLLGRIVAAAHPQAVWLFGSRAAGTAGPDSDFDLMVLFADDDPVTLDDRLGQLTDAVAGAGVGVDLAVCRAAEFDEYRDAAGSLIRTVRGHGREIYVSRAERRRRAGPAA